MVTERPTHAKKLKPALHDCFKSMNT